MSDITTGVVDGYKLYRNALREVYNERQIRTMDRMTIVNSLNTIHMVYKVFTSRNLRGAAREYKNGMINSMIIAAFYGTLLRLQKDKS